MVKMLVNVELVAYVSSFMGIDSTDPNYNPAIDFDNDGKIDIFDVSFLGQLVGTWIELKPKTLQEWFASRPPIIPKIPTQPAA
jgi:hypothetical protein